MSDDELEPLRPDLARMLDAERGEAPLDAKLAAALHSRIRGAVSVDAKPAEVHAPARGFVPRSRVVHAAVLGLAVGGGVGAWVHAQRTPPPAVFVTPVLPTVSAVPEPSAPPSPASTYAPAAPPTPSIPTSAGPPATVGATTNAAERRVVERARTALARGDGAAALEAIHEHEVAYPKGALVEEREYIAILALERTAQSDAAHQRAKRFLRVFPSSVFASSVAAIADAGG